MRLRTWLPRIILILVLALVAWLAWCGVRAAVAGRQAWADLDRLQALSRTVDASSLPALREGVASLDEHLRATEAAAWPFLRAAPAFRWLPRIGPDVAAAPTLLQMAVQLSGAGRGVLDALAPLTDALGGAGEGELLAQAAATLQTAAPQLNEARGRLALADSLRTTLPAQLHPKLAVQVARLERLLPLALAGVDVSLAAPELLGMAGPRAYLILAQNSHELRATGGFISGVGIVRFDHGRIAELKLTDSYAVDNLEQPHPAPPAALSVQMGADMLLLRDSNWSPDFPDSSQVARALYAQDQGVVTDGALAVDLDAVRLLVAALGPLQVPGIDEPVTGANAIAWMKRAWQSPLAAEGTVQQAESSDWWGRRKDFMAELIGAALAKAQAGSDLNLPALAQSLWQMLDGRHLQIAVDDPVLAEMLAERGWDGGLRPPQRGDFLAVIDSNVGFNKANAAVQQGIAYAVASADGGLVATLTLTYTHTAPAGSEPICDRTPRYGDSYDELTRRCYWDYLRVYAPGGSELLAAEGLLQAATEEGERGTTVFAGDFALRPGDQRVVTLRYRLPAEVAAAPYRLFVRKQAGTPAPPLAVAAGACRWETDLAQDRSFACEAR